MTVPAGIPARTVRRQRLANQLLAAERSGSIGGVARHMLALQGQDLPGLLWALALRSAEPATEAEVRGAFDRRELVRSWPMRGTLHAIAGEDLGWMLSITGDRMIQAAAGRQRELGLSNDDLARATKTIEAAFGEKPALTRAELVEAFERAGLEPVGQRAAHMIYFAAEKGLVCLGPIIGKEQLFVSYADWVPERRELERDEALAELARRYLRSHGPATEADLAWWAGITLGDARRGIAGLGASVHTLTSADGPTLLVIEHGADLVLGDDQGAPSPPPGPASSVLLAPGFDETLLGYRDRSYTVSAEHSHRIVPGGNGMFMSTIQREGVAVGLWRRVDRGRRIELTPQPFGTVPKAVLTAVAKSARGYAAFRELPVTVTDPLPVA